jgi:thiamine-monophosphate kinase
MAPASIDDEAEALTQVLALCDPSAGDDAAVLHEGPGASCISTDSTVAGVHAPLATNPHALGRRAAARAISDLAAMGAHPRAMTCAVLVPERGWHDAVAAVAGVAERGREQHMPLVGGDLAGSGGGPLTLVVTVVGHAAGRSGARLVTRSGARSGDLVVVTGTLGHAAAALASRASSIPEPPNRLHAGVALAPHVTSMIDVTDGLVRDAGSLASASGAGIDLQLLEVPVVDSAVVTPLEVVGFGDDYELLATIPAHVVDAARAALAAVDSKVSLTIIGRVVDGDPVVRLRRGDALISPPRGFVHR